MVAHDLHAIALPRLDEAHMSAMGQCHLTALKRYRHGEKLFEVGDRDFTFYIVKSGTVQIVDESGETPKTVTVLGPGEFTGDVFQLTGGPAVVSAVAQGDCEAFEVTPASLRQILNNHPDLGDIILQAFIARRQLLRESGGFVGLRVFGARSSQHTFRIRDFLEKNRVPFTWLDLEGEPEVQELLQQFGVTPSETPVVALSHKLLLRNPTNRQLAETLGLRRPLDQVEYDLVVVGSGPAGLAAAVYGASEGLSTLVLERLAPGGQAERSMRIENYLGFPIGITGSELAERAVVQASKFGACLCIGAQGTGLTFDKMRSVLHIDGGEKVRARCVLIATGADYRLLNVEGCERYEGCGVYYAATPLEAQMCRGSDVVVVGGGNSAGQAAVFLAGKVLKVYLLVRGDSLDANMSSYLARRIEATPTIEVHLNTEVQRMSGEGFLSSVEIVSRKTGEARTLQTPAVFSFIGAVPRTDWLPEEIETDSKGFVRTGAAVAQSPTWYARREPFLLETSRPGVFAAGDVRSGSVKRVASAVGEGAMVVQLVHEYLKEM
jgi:thioredoxin reductase (NADPH)